MAELEPLLRRQDFDDFLFRPQHSPVRLAARGVAREPLAGAMRLALPILGANMDSVIGEEMAKALALEGGSASCTATPRSPTRRRESATSRRVTPT